MGTAIDRPLGEARATAGSWAAIRSKTRWSEWYHSKVPFVFTAAYAAIGARESPRLDARTFADLLGLVVFVCHLAAFGHVVNDVGDHRLDRAAGKPERFSSRSEAVLWAATLLVLSAVVFVLWAPARLDLAVLAGASFLLAAAYSLPPLRLKERGALGLLAAACAQRTLPLALALRTFGAVDAAGTALCVLGTLVGLRHVAIHEREDAENDACAGVRTFATAHGPAAVAHLVRRVLFPLEVAALVVALGLLVPRFPAVLALAALHVPWTAYRARLARHRGAPLSPLSFDLLGDLYVSFLPLVLVGTLAFGDPAFWGVFVANALWQQRKLRRHLKDTTTLFASR